MAPRSVWNGLRAEVCRRCITSFWHFGCQHLGTIRQQSKHRKKAQVHFWGSKRSWWQSDKWLHYCVSWVGRSMQPAKQWNSTWETLINRSGIGNRIQNSMWPWKQVNFGRISIWHPSPQTGSTSVTCIPSNFSGPTWCKSSNLTFLSRKLRRNWQKSKVKLNSCLLVCLRPLWKKIRITDERQLAKS